MKKYTLAFAQLLFLTIILACCSNAAADQESIERESPFVVRPFSPIEKQFKANGISYGPYRLGQRPGGHEPSKKEIEQDLQILAGDKWEMIRTYGVEPFVELACQHIRDEKLPIKIMAGAWIATESDAAQKKNNENQIKKVIELANKYPDVVAAVNVGNETQVFWSFHKVKQQTLIKYIRQVRSKIKQPVTVADDFKFWTVDESKAVADEIDFIVAHMYAMWLGQQLEDAVPWTKKTYASVTKKHPGKKVIIGEAGWATKKADHGDQGKLIKGQAGTEQQKIFFHAFRDWVKEEKIGYFYFEAFDEPWKGGNDANEVEKHWGLFRVNRSRKPAVQK